MTNSAPDGLFHALIIDCQFSWLACRSQGKWWPAVMMIIEIIITSNEFVCVYGGHSGGLGGGGLPAVTGVFDWLMPDARWLMRTHIKRSGGCAEAHRSFSSLRQRYGFIKAESDCGHRSWWWQANIMSGWADNAVMDVRVTGWRGINICKAPGSWWEIAVMAGFLLHWFDFVTSWTGTNALQHCKTHREQVDLIWECVSHKGWIKLCRSALIYFFQF